MVFEDWIGKMEFLIVYLGYNLIKYHRYRLKIEKKRQKELLNFKVMYIKNEI